MDGITFAFIAMPCIGACIAGWALRDWRLAGAMASGGFALLLVLPGSGPLMAYALPFIAGAAVGSLALLPYMKWRSDATVWGRMAVALIATLVAAYANLISMVGGA